MEKTRDKTRISSATQFTYLTLKPSVRPEDPDNDEGRVFTDAYRAVEQNLGYQQAYWGRTLENENDVVWVVEWEDDTGSIPLPPLSPILDPNSTPITFYTSLTPPIAHDLRSSPVIELVVLAFPSMLKFSEKNNLDTDLINFRSTMLNLQGAKPALSFSIGWFDRPGAVQHPENPSGEASLCILVVGWGSKEEHQAARATEEFGKAIKPIREKMLSALKELQMRHVRFKSHDKGHLGMLGVL